MDLGACLLDCLYCEGDFFLVFCFLSGFFNNVTTVYCLFYWPAHLACSQGLPAEVGS